MNKYFWSIVLGTISYTCNAQENLGTIGMQKNSNEQQDILRDTQTIQYGLRGNTLSWLTLSPSIEFDIFTSHHWNYTIGGTYGWWGFTGDQKAIQTWNVIAETRYFFKDRKFTGHSLGFRVQSGQFDVRLKEHGRRGMMTTAGITYAYTWSLSKNNNWYLDAGFGGGYIYQDYTKYMPYKPTQCYHKVYDKNRSTFGLTNVFLNIGYRFPVQQKKGGMQ